MKIVSYESPWCEDLYATVFDRIGEELGEKNEVVKISSFRDVDNSGFWHRYQKEVRSAPKKESCELTIEQNEIIKRCRLLRVLPVNTALTHVEIATKIIGDILDDEKPGLVFSESVDQYLHDILFREAEKRQIRMIAFVHSFINGHYRVSIRGEASCVREVGQEEIEREKKKLLDKTYIPTNLIKIKQNLFKSYMSVMVKNILRVFWFSLMRVIKKDMYNYHYWSSSRCNINEFLHFIPKLKLGHNDWRERLKESEKPVIFIPLQHVPEATVDYWTNDIELIDYAEVLNFLIAKLSPDFTVLIKEHPGVWGYRKPKFYKRLERHPGIVIAPTNTSALECCSFSDAVLVWTGTVGFEAALRGLKVLTLTDVYYSFGPLFKKIDKNTPNNVIEEFILDRGELDTLMVDAMVKNLLEGCMEGRFRNDGTFDLNNTSHRAEAHSMARDIISYLKLAA